MGIGAETRGTGDMSPIMWLGDAVGNVHPFIWDMFKTTNDFTL